MNDLTKRPRPKGLGPRQGRHGGRIVGWGDDELSASPATPAEPERAPEVNALEAALSRTPYGQQMLGLLGEAATLRLREGLAVELVRSATETLDRLRRALLTTRDGLERERIAEQLPAASDELQKWSRALSDYTYRRERTEIELRDGMRALV